MSAIGGRAATTALAPERIVSVVLAAGAGRRFGGRKQLAPLRGRPLLEHALVTAAASPSDSTLVVLGADAEEVVAGIELGGVAVVLCPDWERGQGASLRTGLAALGPEVGTALVTLGDEPFVPHAAGERLLAARRPGIAALRASYIGRPGHPVLLERELFGPLCAAYPAAKPASLLSDAGVETVECGDLGDPADIDTKAQLAALERRGAERAIDLPGREPSASTRRQQGRRPTP